MFVGRARPYAQPRGSALFRSARPRLAQWPSHPCWPAGPACVFTTPSGMLRNRCSFCPARGTVDLDRKGRRGPGSGRPVRRSADALIASRASGEFVGQGSRRRCGADLDLGSAVQKPQDLLVTPGRAHPQSESHFQMEGFRAKDRHNPLPHIAPLTTTLKSFYENTAFLSTRTSAELRELLIPGRPGMMVPRAAPPGLWPWRDCVTCVIAQRQLCFQSDDRRIASFAVCVTSCGRARLSAVSAYPGSGIGAGPAQADGTTVTAGAAPVRAENLVRSCDQQSCPPVRPAAMIIGHVPCGPSSS
jgi:hypothetical protein